MLPDNVGWTAPCYLGHKTRFTQAARRRGSSAPDCRFFIRGAARWKRVMQKIMSCSLHLLN